MCIHDMGATRQIGMDEDTIGVSSHSWAPKRMALAVRISSKDGSLGRDVVRASMMRTSANVTFNHVMRSLLTFDFEFIDEISNGLTRSRVLMRSLAPMQALVPIESLSG